MKRGQLLSLELLREPAAPQQESDDIRQAREKLYRTLKTLIAEELTEPQKKCVMLYYFEKRKQSEISQELGVNISTVSRHLKRARRNLEHILRYLI